MNFELHDSDYTIFHSMRDSVRFAVDRTIIPFRKHVCCKSSFVDCMGTIMSWHDFGDLEGPGWAANAVGGACEIHGYAEYEGGDRSLASAALGLLDHVLDDGFIEYDTGFVFPYRDTVRDQLCLNFKHKDDWLCPGSMAKIGYQMLVFADRLKGDARASVLQDIAARMASWLQFRVRPLRNGWYPRRTGRDGTPYARSAEGHGEPLLDKSADGLFIVQLMAGLTERGLADWRREIRRRLNAFMDAGGLFGSINHDTYDRHENVAYSVGFRVLRAAANLLDDRKMRAFAYERCLAGLDRFKMCDDRNGCRTKGLLFMEKSWDTSYMWENAEAALAYVEAFEETGRPAFRDQALTILQAIAKHHHGPYGFLSEGCDWNNHVGRQHHFWKDKCGDIQYTEPLLNNLHIVEPTLHLARLWPEIRI
jgi:hypothetical protein